jgi:rod shape-determining protein MreC
MNVFFRLFVKLRVFLLFFVLEIVAVSLLSYSSYYQRTAIVGVVRLGKGKIDGWLENGSYYFSLKEVNKQLAAENNALRNRLESYGRLHDRPADTTVTDSLGQPVFSYLPATVVSNRVNHLHNYMLLNAGTEQGVNTDMGVMMHNGVIGTVVEVYEHYSLVKSLLNVDWRVSAKLAGNGAFGSLYWDGKDYREVLLTEIPQHIPIQVGDTVISSGYSSLFPADIPIGTIKSYQVKRGNFYEITVVLFADFKRIHAVNIVKHLHRNELKTIKFFDNSNE